MTAFDGAFAWKEQPKDMTGSMYAAIAGLQTHMQKMNVIGNNIANANTYGFKPGVTTFTESMYTSVNASAAGGTQFGGTNASQIGYGSKVSSIDLNMSGGTYAPTGTNSNLYLDGNGFFLVGQKPDAAQGDPSDGYIGDPNDLTLTRVGNFRLDGDGYLVDANGYCVYGFMPLGEDNGALQTDADGNLTWDTCLRPIRLPVEAPASADADALAQGKPVYAKLTGATGTAADNVWTYPHTITDTSKRISVDAVNLSVGSNGVITVVTQDGTPTTIGVVAVGSVVNPNGLTKQSNGYYLGGNNAGNLRVGTCGEVITGKYLSNETAQGNNAIDPSRAVSGAGTTKIISGGLESSKTDIATEFADMITTQRGFQANTKIITVTDEMLSDLVAMKR